MRKKYIEVQRTMFAPWPDRMEADDRLLRSWRTRLALEGFDGRFWFVTITYNDESLPPDLMPDRKHVTDFLKRFRSRLTYRYGDPRVANFRVFLASDFGGNFNRPHYHALFFGLPFDKHWKSLMIRSWHQGFLNIRVGNIQRINYVTKYLTKRHDPDMFFTIKSEGIGMSFLDRPGFIDRQRQRRSTLVTWNGKEYRLPRYMLNKVFPDDFERREILAKEYENINNRYYVQFLCSHGRDWNYLVFNELSGEYDIVPITKQNVMIYERKKVCQAYQRRRDVQRQKEIDLFRLRGLAISAARA